MIDNPTKGELLRYSGVRSQESEFSIQNRAGVRRSALHAMAHVVHPDVSSTGGRRFYSDS